jgi:NMD protein affecting ribosome stability and mRNA decay
MKGERGGFRGVRHEQRFEGLEKDPYKEAGKPPEPARCPDCGAVFQRGRWTWATAPEGAHAAPCPACRRIREGMPAGFVRLKGEFFRGHRDEVLARVRSCEAAEKREHPLQRIMAVQAEGEEVLVTTTDVHLARRIGDALHDAWKGELHLDYNKEETLVRVSWSR